MKVILISKNLVGSRRGYLGVSERGWLRDLAAKVKSKADSLVTTEKVVSSKIVFKHVYAVLSALIMHTT